MYINLPISNAYRSIKSYSIIGCKPVGWCIIIKNAFIQCFGKVADKLNKWQPFFCISKSIIRGWLYRKISKED